MSEFVSSFRFHRFVPHPLVRGGNLQTILGNSAIKTPDPDRSKVHQIDLDGEDGLLVYEDKPRLDQETAPIVITFHGLGGCCESKYNVRIGKKLADLNFRTLRFNHRGCGPGGSHLASEIFHAGRIEDFWATIQYAHYKWPGSRIMLVGFSLSADMLLSLLGQYKEEIKNHPRIIGAMAVCPPLDLGLCLKTLTSIKNKHLDIYYSRRVFKIAKNLGQRIPEKLPDDLPRFFGMKSFDNRYTIKHAGFDSAEEYYEQCSSHQWLESIELPSVILASENDPIIPKTVYTHAKFSPSTKLHLKKSGGHMGYVSKGRTRFSDRYWMDEAVVHWAEELLRYHS